VRIYFPRAEPAGIEPINAGAAAPSAGSETVLVVEDDEDVRAFLREMLSAQGYRTLGARNGPEALTILDQEQEISLLLADIFIPEAFN
jgi:CheY-like chemotaxis protein